MQGGGEAGKAAADDDDVIHGDGLRVLDGGGGLGLARHIVQRYALETGSGAGPRLCQEEEVMGSD